MNNDPDSIAMWSDGTWCYWEDMGDMNHMSDDYQLIPFGTTEYNALASLEY